MPELPETGRRYVENTGRARLASPGVERFPRNGGSLATRVVLIALVVAGILAGLLWLAH